MEIPKRVKYSLGRVRNTAGDTDMALDFKGAQPSWIQNFGKLVFLLFVQVLSRKLISFRCVGDLRMVWMRLFEQANLPVMATSDGTASYVDGALEGSGFMPDEIVLVCVSTLAAYAPCAVR